MEAIVMGVSIPSLITRITKVRGISTQCPGSGQALQASEKLQKAEPPKVPSLENWECGLASTSENQDTRNWDSLATWWSDQCELYSKIIMLLSLYTEPYIFDEASCGISNNHSIVASC